MRQFAVCSEMSGIFVSALCNCFMTDRLDAYNNQHVTLNCNVVRVLFFEIRLLQLLNWPHK